MKSAEYVGTVVSAYRRVLDSLGGGPEVEERALREARDILQNDFARRKTLFHFDGVRADGWLNAESAGGTGIPLGRVLRVKAGRGFTDARDITVAVGDSIRVHKGDDSSRAVHKVTFVQTDDAGLWLSLPEGFGLGDTVYLIQTKAMTRRYAPVIAKHLEGHRAPGHEKAPPPPPLVKIKKDKDDEIPPGLVALVRRPEDLYVLQSARPEKAALRYRSAFVPLLLARGKSPLPFAPRDLVIALDPFFPQASDEDLAKNIPLLLEKGYHFFILNNPGQFSFFRGTDAVLIAGPWLYTFNGYAAAFFAGLGARYFIPPLEDNRQNLEKTFQREGGARALALVTLFSSPPLFRIRADLAACSTLNNSVKNSRDFTLFEAAADKVRRGLCPLGVCREENCAKTQFSLSNSAKRCKLLEGGYPFKVFADSRGEQFRLDSGGGEGTLVYPEKPFSIVDKARFLREAGFNKFLLDLSAAPLKKHDYRAITLALQKGAPLPNTGRFNWKEGFFAQKD
jgi:putative protease